MNSVLLKSQLHDEHTFYQKFWRDLEGCTKEVIIESPYITTERMRTFDRLFHKLLKNGVKIYIITRDPREHDEFTAGAHWTLTATSEAKALSVTMIVRGSPWWTRDKLWFTKDGADYACDEDTFKKNPGFRELETMFTDKTNTLREESTRKNAEAMANQTQERDNELRSRAGTLINSLEPDPEDTTQREGNRRNPEKE